MGNPQTCDPTAFGLQFHTGEIAYFDGEVSVAYEWDWDGVSVVPECNGPLRRIRGQNRSTGSTYYAWFQGRNGFVRSLALPPGFDGALTRAQLVAAGYANKSDVEGLTITDTPVSPF